MNHQRKGRIQPHAESWTSEGHWEGIVHDSCDRKKKRERQRSCFWRKVDRCGGTINRPVEYRLRGRHDCHYYRCSLPVSVNMAVGLWRPGLSTNAPGGRCTMHRRGQDADFEIGKCKVAVQRTNQGTPAQSIFAIETAPRRGIVKESRACNARREKEEEKFTIGIALSDAINQTWQFSSDCGSVVADFVRRGKISVEYILCNTYV